MGYQKGSDNIACRPDIKKKILEGIKKSLGKKCFDILGSAYRSSLEVKVANYLINNHIGFVYEGILHMDDTYVLPDFTIENRIILEVNCYMKSGEEKYFDRYINKLKLYLEKTSYHIIVVTYTKWSGSFSSMQTISSLFLFFS